MSDERNPETDPQPAPIPNDFDSSHDVAIRLLEERKEFGIKKYGTTLQPFNGRDSLQDAIDEVLDLLVYLVTCQRERNITGLLDDIGLEPVKKSEKKSKRKKSKK